MIPGKIISIILAFSLIFGSYAQDQKSGSITGFVKDAASKTLLIDVVVTVSSDAFVGQKFVVTDTSGYFQIINLPPGNYTINAEMEGYKKVTRDNIALKENSAVEISVELTKSTAKMQQAKNKNFRQ